MLSCTCCIVPQSVLERLAADKKSSAATRKASADSVRVTELMRSLRVKSGELTGLAQKAGAHRVQLAAAPLVTVYDCKNSQTLPGTPVKSPRTSADATAKRTAVSTSAVARFYKDVFGRNSIDNAGMTLMSSIHFGSKYNNAMWNGSQMIYGDGDGQIFIDFTQGNDVIGHELTHGVTQHTLRLDYSGDAGGLNESMSDCFGTMFRQWQAKQTVDQADWLIGADIMGAAAKARGFSCLRNMAQPDDAAALAPQPTHYSQVTPGMDPHESSGPPNLAFTAACNKLGGKSWERVGQVWYAALTTSGAKPKTTMKQFAARTRALAKSMFVTDPAVRRAVDQGWKLVGL